MGGGLSEKARDWYCTEILKILRKYGKCSSPFIISQLRKIGQRRYPVTEERVVAFLKYLRACGVVTYTKSPIRKISSKWELRISIMRETR